MSFSGLLVAVSIVAIVVFGLRLGIDFTGGSLMEISFSQERPSNEAVVSALSDFQLNNVYVQPTGDNGLLIRTDSLDEEKHQQVLAKLKDEFATPIDSELPTSDQENIETEGLEVDLTNQQFNEVTEERFDSIGPTIGAELRSKALTAIILVLLAIILYLAYAFRKVSKPVPSWQYGVSAVIALAHDILIVIGIFAFLGYFFDVTIDAFFVTALLTILGFSVHDTIVTFDRIRENIFRYQDKTFAEVINASINETIIRSLNTSITTLIVLIAIMIFGGESIKFFILALVLGIIAGTYSSIFIACPLLYQFFRLKK